MESILTFWFDCNTGDVGIHVGKEIVFISHRFSEEDVKEMIEKVGGLNYKISYGNSYMVCVIRKV